MHKGIKRWWLQQPTLADSQTFHAASPGMSNACSFGILRCIAATVLQFVARFTENNLDGENLARIYSRVSKGHGARDAPADRDASAAAAGPSRADPADDDDFVAPDRNRRRSHSEAREHNTRCTCHILVKIRVT